jgi:hypothetical protein
MVIDIILKLLGKEIIKKFIIKFVEDKYMKIWWGIVMVIFILWRKIMRK